MLICLFTAFLFFIVRQPAYDDRPLIKPAHSVAIPVIHSVSAENLPEITHFEPTETRQAA